jgi:hypothetical protein
MSERLPTGLWVSAHVARCTSLGMPVVVVRRGDPHRGVVIVKQHRPGAGFRLVTQSRDLDDRLTWQPVIDGTLVAEAEADRIIERQVAYDPDLWVIEIEMKAGDEDPFQGPVA